MVKMGNCKVRKMESECCFYVNVVYDERGILF